MQVFLSALSHLLGREHVGRGTSKCDSIGASYTPIARGVRESFERHSSLMHNELIVIIKALHFRTWQRLWGSCSVLIKRVHPRCGAGTIQSHCRLHRHSSRGFWCIILVLQWRVHCWRILHNLVRPAAGPAATENRPGACGDFNYEPQAIGQVIVFRSATWDTEHEWPHLAKLCPASSTCVLPRGTGKWKPPKTTGYGSNPKPRQWSTLFDALQQERPGNAGIWHNENGTNRVVLHKLNFGQHSTTQLFCYVRWAWGTACKRTHYRANVARKWLSWVCVFGERVWPSSAVGN